MHRQRRPGASCGGWIMTDCTTISMPVMNGYQLIQRFVFDENTNDRRMPALVIQTGAHELFSRTMDLNEPRVSLE